MSDHFSQADWEFVRSRAVEVAAQLRAKGARANDLVPLPPVPPSQVTEFTGATGLTLPPDFVDLVTKHAGGWQYDWNLWVPMKDQPDRQLTPPVYLGEFGGNGDVPFIGASPTTSLLQVFTVFQAVMEDHGPEDPESRAIVKRSFPLHTLEGGGGDYTVLRLDLNPARICHLDHEAAHEFRDDGIICDGFGEFVAGWAALGFPGCDKHDSWVDAERRRPISSGAKFDAWLAWLADPAAGLLPETDFERRVREDYERSREQRLAWIAANDALETDHRCPFCGKPCASYRKTCKHCGRDVRGAR